MNKNERAQQRKELYEKRLSELNSVFVNPFLSKFYNEQKLESMIPSLEPSKPHNIILKKETTCGYLRTAINETKIRYDENIAVLNFASFYHPGGGFLKGSIAQEEELCENSLLFKFLEVSKNIYKKRSRDLVEDGYNGDIILSKNVPFYLNKKNPLYVTRDLDVISCSAPNRTALENMVEKTIDKAKLITKLYDIYYTRILNIFKLVSGNYDYLVAGAWGCGVFGNDPSQVAEVFKDVYYQHEFDRSFNLVFAIPDEKTFNVFKEIVTDSEYLESTNDNRINQSNDDADLGESLPYFSEQ